MSLVDQVPRTDSCTFTCESLISVEEPQCQESLLLSKITNVGSVIFSFLTPKETLEVALVCQDFSWQQEICYAIKATPHLLNNYFSYVLNESITSLPNKEFSIDVDKLYDGLLRLETADRETFRYYASRVTGLSLKNVSLDIIASITVIFADYNKFTYLDLSGNWSVTNEALEMASKITNLRELRLSHCIRTFDLSLENLDKFTRLERLYLNRCIRMTDATLKVVGNITNLSFLDLSECERITNDGLKELVELVNLETLNLSFCFQITEVGLKNLVSLPSLKKLYLRACIGIVADKAKVLLRNVDILGLNRTEIVETKYRYEIASLRDLNVVEQRGGDSLCLRLEVSNMAGTVLPIICSLLKANRVKELYLGSNNCSSYDGPEMLADALENNFSLQVLHLGSNYIREERAKKIADALVKSVSLEVLDFGSNKIGAFNVGIIIDSLILKKGGPLRELYCGNFSFDLPGSCNVLVMLTRALKGDCCLRALEVSSLGVKAISEIAEVLGENKTLRKLSISKSYAFEKWNEIFAAIVKNTYLHVLELTYNYLREDNADWLANMLEKNSSLLELNISCNNFGGEGALKISRGLAKNRSLRKLYFRDNDIGAVGAYGIVVALHGNNSLYVLDLGGNKIGSTDAKSWISSLIENQMLRTFGIGNAPEDIVGGKGVFYFGEVLKENCFLQELDISENNLGEVGGEKIAESLEMNRSLRVLNISRNDIRDRGAEGFAKLLEKNGTLLVLRIGERNHIGFKGIARLGKALEKNRTLLELSIPSNYCARKRERFRSAQVLIEAVGKNRSLRVLDLCRWSICKKDGINKLAKALEKNVTLRTLRIERNGIDDCGAFRIVEALEKNQSLIELDISHNAISLEGMKSLLISLIKGPLRILNIQRISPHDLDLSRRGRELIDNLSEDFYETDSFVKF